jgi:hypothetical protein
MKYLGKMEATIDKNYTGQNKKTQIRYVVNKLTLNLEIAQ